MNKTKTLLLLLASVQLAFAADRYARSGGFLGGAGRSAPERPLPPDPKYKPQPEDFRIADGKLYNILVSTNWNTWISGPEMRVRQVLTNGVIFHLIERGGTCLVKNYPGLLTQGQTIKAYLRVMRAGVFQYAGETIPAYDFGLANTPENRKTLKP